MRSFMITSYGAKLILRRSVSYEISVQNNHDVDTPLWSTIEGDKIVLILRYDLFNWLHRCSSWYFVMDCVDRFVDDYNLYCPKITFVDEIDLIAFCLKWAEVLTESS